MREDEAKQFIRQCYEHLLYRSPNEDDMRAWLDLVNSGRAANDVFSDFLRSDEYRGAHPVRPGMPPGHYYSPIVNPKEVRQYFEKSSRETIADLNASGVKVDPQKIVKTWRSLLPIIQTTPFTEERSPENRYYYRNGFYPHGDAITLRAMIGYLRPRRIIEIGSGFSSACILDAADHADLDDFHMTCIDPDGSRLREVMTAADMERVTIIEAPVQEIPREDFTKLDANDILFIDSSHVLKTGSDVHYELFSIIPRLKPGVFVHFHDIPYPFEYLSNWIFDERLSWNEAYALRAFLTFNTDFEIVFWGSLMVQHHRRELEKTFPLFLKSPGGALWLRRTSRRRRS